MEARLYFKPFPPSTSAAVFLALRNSISAYGIQTVGPDFSS